MMMTTTMMMMMMVMDKIRQIFCFDGDLVWIVIVNAFGVIWSNLPFALLLSYI